MNFYDLMSNEEILLNLTKLQNDIECGFWSKEIQHLQKEIQLIEKAIKDKESSRKEEMIRVLKELKCYIEIMHEEYVLLQA